MGKFIYTSDQITGRKLSLFLSPVDTAAAVHGRLQVAGVRTPPHTQTGVSVSSALVARGERPEVTASRTLQPAPLLRVSRSFGNWGSVPPSPPQTTAHASSNRLNVRRLSQHGRSIVAYFFFLSYRF